MRHTRHTTILLALMAGQGVAGPGVAGPGVAGDTSHDLYVDNPGFCDAPAGEQELADLAILDEAGINSHAVSCTWLPDPLDYPPGLIAEQSAQCDNGARTWIADFAISVDDRGRVTAFDDGSTGLPDFYFPCSRWGWKGGSTDQATGD